jgi:1,4-dihydroxy-2-naphthoate octaprenyltransferase
MNPWILASRPKTLSASVVPVLVGTGLALRENDPVPWFYFLVVLLGAVAIQIGTNMINDALDFRKGADTGARLGPMRVTQAGLLSAETVLRGGTVALFIGALCGIPLIYRAGWPLLLIGVASIVCAYAYTGGPYPLAYHGLGEIFVLIFFGFIAVGGTYYVLTLRYGAAAVGGGFMAGSFAVAILAINNLRDIPSDRASSKNTIAVRIGPAGARLEIAVFALAPFLVLLAVAWYLRAWSILAAAAALPLAVVVIRCVYGSEGGALNRCLAMAGGLQWAFGALFLIACLF